MAAEVSFDSSRYAAVVTVPSKMLTLDDVRDSGAIPTPRRLEMRNLKKGSRTAVELPEVTYNTGLQEDLFTQRYLDRGPP